MRKFKHIETGRILDTTIAGVNKVEGLKWGDWEIPMWVVEEGNDWEEVKQKDYTIISFKYIGTDFIISTLRSNEKYASNTDQSIEGDLTEEDVFESGVFRISSVMRLNDKKTFAIGDKSKTDEIVSFTKENDTIFVNTKLGSSKLNELGLKRSMFISADGVEVFEDDTFYIVDNMLRLREVSGRVFIADKWRSRRYYNKDVAQLEIDTYKVQYNAKDVARAVCTYIDQTVSLTKIIKILKDGK